MRRISLAIAVALMLTGCDSKQVSSCESALKANLKAPATYKRVEARIIPIPVEIHNPPYDQVRIKYDAANSFNAELRDEYTCTYRPGTNDPYDPFPVAADSPTTTDLNATAE